MIAALTATGLAAAAGLNAYIPFLLIALVGRYNLIWSFLSISLDGRFAVLRRKEGRA